MIANDPTHLGGAIDAHGADKASRFMQLCDGFGLPLLFLCDTPGFMVGPQAERTATVRHFSRMFVTGANLEVPTGTVILRKGYGLGAQAMAGGGFKAPLFTVGWPTSEFGAMGLEGAVRLGMRRELEAIEDPDERQRAFEATVAAAYERGKGISMAEYFEIDDVIDPADTRRWIEMLFDDARAGTGALAPASGGRTSTPGSRDRADPAIWLGALRRPVAVGRRRDRGRRMAPGAWPSGSWPGSWASNGAGSVVVAQKLRLGRGGGPECARLTPTVS